jgi:anti-sigma regulatory factor (Ser/Thr protein kinase)
MLTRAAAAHREDSGPDVDPACGDVSWPVEIVSARAADRRTPTVRIASCVVPASTRMVGALRSATTRHLRRWGVNPDGGAFDLLVLAVSELATNAIRHGPRGDAVRIAVTWGAYRGGAGPDRVSVSVLDGGHGGLRIRDAASDDDLPEGQYGLPLLLRSGLRIEPTVLPAASGRGSGHLVTAWTPVRARARARVCACPCWVHGYGIARCQGLIAGTRRNVALFGGLPVACCPPCVGALRLSAPDDAVFHDGSELSCQMPAEQLVSAGSGSAWRR